LPRQVTTHEHRDFLDTPENRFVKHALGAFVQFLSAMERRVSGLPEPDSPANRRLRQDICGLRNRLQVWLGHPLFREVSGPDMLPLGSPVLQRRQGYREIYRAWMQFNLAARLVWQGGDDVFAAGKRDVAVLYEYWVFFRLLEAITALYGLRRLPVQELIERTADGFGLKLKSGRHLTIEGDYQGGPLPLRIRFAYNLTFSRSGEGEVSYPAKGSWTYRLRPDYTLSLWPAGLAEDDAERQEQIVHLHFDAKYRVQSRSGAKVSSIVDLFGDDADDAAGGAEQEERAGRMSKRSDLLKMHAYRDAIRRTEGAYIIYPGDTEKRWCGFRELLPGVGAFPVYPGDEVRGMRSITDFLEKVTVLCQDRFCQLRRRQYWTHEAAREAPQDYAAARPSPAHGAPPDDLTVTVGFVPPELQMVVRERRAFFFHAVYSDGRRAKVDPRELRGRYLVPYCNHGPIGWYAEAKTCRLVQRRTVERLIGAAAMAARDAGRDDSRRPTHYYVMRLGAVHDGLPVEAGRWRELIAARAPQGAPFTATWWTLWEGMWAESRKLRAEREGERA
jgi:predicted component of viral defense system (DUF524 family)